MINREDRLFRRFCRTGDPDALAAVFDRLAPDLLRLARMMVGRGAADDVLQATFVDAIEHRARFDQERRVRPWLCEMLANHARRHQRTVARQAEALRAAANRAGARLHRDSETHRFARSSVVVRPGEITDLGDVRVEESARLTLRVPGLTAAEADGLRVWLVDEHAVQLDHDPASTDTWLLERPALPGPYRLIVLGRETTPIARDVELVPGDNRLVAGRLRGRGPFTEVARDGPVRGVGQAGTDRRADRRRVTRRPGAEVRLRVAPRQVPARALRPCP